MLGVIWYKYKYHIALSYNWKCVIIFFCMSVSEYHEDIQRELQNNYSFTNYNLKKCFKIILFHIDLIKTNKQIKFLVCEVLVPLK